MKFFDNAILGLTPATRPRKSDSKNSDNRFSQHASTSQIRNRTDSGMITHNPRRRANGDRIIHMADGEIVGRGKIPHWNRHKQWKTCEHHLREKAPLTHAISHRRVLSQKSSRRISFIPEADFSVHPARRVLMRARPWELDAAQTHLSREYPNVFALAAPTTPHSGVFPLHAHLLETTTPYDYQLIAPVLAMAADSIPCPFVSGLLARALVWVRPFTSK